MSEFIKTAYEYPGTCLFILFGLMWLIESIGDAIAKARVK